jgi:hypothetical protein
MPQAIPKGLTRAAVLQALADLDAGAEHPFGAPTGYELVHEGRRYAPKTVIGLACRSVLGRLLTAGAARSWPRGRSSTRHGSGRRRTLSRPRCRYHDPSSSANPAPRAGLDRLPASWAAGQAFRDLEI